MSLDTRVEPADWTPVEHFPSLRYRVRMTENGAIEAEVSPSPGAELSEPVTLDFDQTITYEEDGTIRVHLSALQRGKS